MDRGEPGVAIVALRGEHETFSAHKIASTLESLLDEGVAVVVDLTEADFLDSAVVGALLRTRVEAIAREAKLAIVVDDTTGWAVRRLFEITGLGSIFEVTPTRDAAVAAVR